MIGLLCGFAWAFVVLTVTCLFVLLLIVVTPLKFFHPKLFLWLMEVLVEGYTIPKHAHAHAHAHAPLDTPAHTPVPQSSMRTASPYVNIATKQNSSQPLQKEKVVGNNSNVAPTVVSNNMESIPQHSSPFPDYFANIHARKDPNRRRSVSLVSIF